VLGFEKDMTGFEDNTHPALAQAAFELITSIEDRFT
jgi:hypothetical protein